MAVTSNQYGKCSRYSLTVNETVGGARIHSAEAQVVKEPWIMPDQDSKR
jgi:hypothetical protein